MLPDMRELCEAERLLQGEESNVVLDLPPASSYEEIRVFHYLCINSLAGEVYRLILIRNIVISCSTVNSSFVNDFPFKVFIFTQSNRDVIVEPDYFSTVRVLLETVGRSENVSTRPD